MMGTGNCKVRREMRKNLGMLVADMRVSSGNDANWELQSDWARWQQCALGETSHSDSKKETDLINS
jgi:hypothetical protein